MTLVAGFAGPPVPRDSKECGPVPGPSVDRSRRRIFRATAQ